VTCNECLHFSITWNPRLPYRCKAWGVVCRQHPHALVQSSSGVRCQLFEPRALRIKSDESNHSSERGKARRIT